MNIELDLKRILRLLAADSEEQLAYLRSIGDACELVDELGLEFDDVWVMLRQEVQNGGITPVQYDSVRAVNDALSRISGLENALFWTRDALKNGSEWAEIRKLARTALNQL